MKEIKSFSADVETHRKTKPETAIRALDRGENAEILSVFTSEQQAEIRSKQRILSSLAYFIGKDFHIPVELNEPGKGWHWDFKKNVIRIDPKDLLEKPLDYLRFVICHEGGHRRISRTDFIPMEVWQQPGFAFMMNSIEDPRDNNFVAESYPKFREQMILAYEDILDIEVKAKAAADQKLGYQPRFMQAGFEYIRQWFREVKEKNEELSEDLPEEVKVVVQATLDAARNSWLRYPSRQEADRSEELIKQYAEVSYEINRDEIWPEFKKLVDADTEDQKTQEAIKEMQKNQKDEEDQELPQALKDRLKPEEQKALQEAIRQTIDGKPADLNSLPEALKQKIKEYVDSLPPEEKKKIIERARTVLKEFEDAMNKELGGKLLETPEQKAEREKNPEEPPMSGGETVWEGEAKEPMEITGMLKYRERLTRVLNKDANVYEQYRREVLPLIDKLEMELRELFVARTTTNWKGGFAVGKRIDIKKRIQEKAKSTSVIESKAWQKRELPDEKNYAITLLVDLSGSMKKDKKIEETFKAVIVLAEALNRLGISVEILGYNDDLYEYQNFGQPISKQIREHMGGMFQEVEDSCCKICGNEHAETDLGWATTIAIGRLAKRKEENKWLITFFDGILEESNKHPHTEFEAEAIIKNAAEEANAKMIGLGIGRGTGGVAGLYPISMADIGVREMAERLAKLMKGSITKSG